MYAVLSTLINDRTSFFFYACIMCHNVKLHDFFLLIYWSSLSSQHYLWFMTSKIWALLSWDSGVLKSTLMILDSDLFMLRAEWCAKTRDHQKEGIQRKEKITGLRLLYKSLLLKEGTHFYKNLLIPFNGQLPTLPWWQ